MARCLLPLSIGLALASAASAATPAPNRWAVVIAVDRVLDPGIPATPNALADAGRLRDYLTTSAGYSDDHVLLLAPGGQPFTDVARPPARVAPTRRNIRVALGMWLPRVVKKGDSVLVYFAGQAAVDGTTPVLIPEDAALGDLAGTSVDATWIAATLARLPASWVASWYDTSLAGRGARLGPGKGASLGKLAPGRRGTVWMAAGPSQVAGESPARPHGAFTDALLEALRASDGRLEASWAALRKHLPKGAPAPQRAGAKLAAASLHATRKVERPRLVLQTGHSGFVRSIAFSPNGKLVATGGQDRRVKLWDAADMRVQATLAGAHEEEVVYLFFSADGKRLVSFDIAGYVALWEVPLARLIRRWEPDTDELMGNVQVSAELERLIIDRFDQPLALIDAATGKQRRLKHLPKNVVAALAPDGKRLAMQSDNGALALHSVDNKGRRTLAKPAVKLNRLRFSPDGRYLAGITDGGALVWEVASGRLRLRAGGAKTYYLAFSGDSARIAVQHAKGVGVFALPSGKQLVDVPGRGRPELSRDGQTLLVSTAYQPLRVWEVPSGKLRNELPHHAAELPTVRMSPDGRQLVHLLPGRTVQLYDTHTGQLRGALEGASAALHTAKVSPDGRILEATDSHGATQLWDLVTGRPVRQRPAKGADASQSLAGLRFVATDEGVIQLYERKTKRHLATLAQLYGGSEWAVTTPQGLFDGSRGGQALLQWRIGDKLFALEQFYRAFHEPRLLRQLIDGKRPRPRLSLSTVRPPPRVHIAAPRPGTVVSKGSVDVRMVVSDQGGGLSAPWLYHNGHRVAATRGAVAVGGKTVAIPVDLVEGRNHLRAIAFNADGNAASRGDETTVVWDVPPASRPVLHILGVGIDRYRAGINLNFAARDAQAIAAAFRPGLFGDVKATLLVDSSATRTRILAALEQLAKVARPRDTVLVYFAGHGALVGEVFHFLPHDADIGSEAALKKTGVSEVELGEALIGIPATKQIVVLDACHSGASTGALGRMLGRRDAIGLVRAQKRLARASGSFLIAASTAAQYAKEVPGLRHGVLTYAFLAGLGLKPKAPAAAVNSDGQITVNSLISYLSEQVPKLTAKHHGGRQEPVQASTGQDFPLVLVSK